MRTACVKSITERALLWACIGASGLWVAAANAADEAPAAVPIVEDRREALESVPPLEKADDSEAEAEGTGSETEGNGDATESTAGESESTGDATESTAGESESTETEVPAVASSAGDPAEETAAESVHGEAGTNAEPVSVTAEAPPPDAIVPIEEALDEESGPLDSVAFSIEQAEYDGTEEFLERYIRAIETAHHRYHPDLVEPLILLGDAQLGQQRHDRALETFARALHIRRINNGLFAPEQVAVVYKQADALKAIGNLEEAGNREEYAYSVLYKAYGPLSEEILPGTYRLADWYRDSFNIFAARAMYERALHVYEANDKQTSLSALPALRGLVFTYRQERFPPYYMSDNQSSSFGVAPTPLSSRGTVFTEQITINNFPAAERALQHIVRIRRDNPESSPLEVFEAILDLADWHLMWEHYKKAHALYEFVYEQLNELDSVDASAYFAKPLLLHMPLPADPKPPRGVSEGEATERDRIPGFIEASFRVSANGSAQNIEVVAADPEGLMDFRTRRSLRSSRYRPAMENGKAIPYESQTWRHEFQYVPPDKPEEDDA